MSINGIGTAGYLTWRETGKAQRNNSVTDFANKLAGADAAESAFSQSGLMSILWTKKVESLRCFF